MIFGMELAAADEVVFTATAPSKVILGQQFRLTYTLNAETKDLRIPEITDFEVLMGPSTAKSTQISIVNGQRTSLVEHSYTYVLMPVKVGSFTIPAATATIKKKKELQSAYYYGSFLRIKVQAELQTRGLPRNKQPVSMANRHLSERSLPKLKSLNKKVCC